jgi:segregation and condensation protein B
MNEHYLRNVIEAALLAAGRPVQPAELIQLFDEGIRPTGEQMRAAIDALAAEYAERGIELKETCL